MIVINGIEMDDGVDEPEERCQDDKSPQAEAAGSFAAPAGSAYYGVRVEVVGDDRLSCSAHLRMIADMITSGDAPGWTTSDVNGSANADRFTPNSDATGSATAEYIRGVNAACEWLEKYKLTEEEENDGVSWLRDCPQTFAWLIRTDLLPPNAKISKVAGRKE